jgi:hypothetical protein
MNPNFAIGQYSLAFGPMFDGRSAEGFDRVDRARRLSPYDPMTFAFFAQHASMHALIENSEQSADWADKAVRQPNAHYHLYAIAAYCNDLIGRRAVAARHVVELRRLQPD